MPDDLARVESGSLIAADKLAGTSVFNIEHLDDDFHWTADYGRTIDKYYGAPPSWP